MSTTTGLAGRRFGVRCGIAALLASAAWLVACEGEPPPAGDDVAANAPSPGEGGAATGSDPGFDPADNPCQGHASELLCLKNAAVSCDDAGKVASQKGCAEEVCVAGTGCVLCIDGQFSCFGNEVRACNTTVTPIAWDTLATCDPVQGQHCNAKAGACEAVTTLGNGPDSPTGSYYQFAKFVTGSSEFKGGCDVDSYGDYIYVNRGSWYDDGATLDVYRIELLDSDGDGKKEPNQHPDNPDAPGIIEERVLTFVGSHSIPSLGMVHHSEVYAIEDRVFFLDAPADPGVIYQYEFQSAVTSPVVVAPPLEFAQLGFDDVNGVWYASSEGARQVYSFHQPTNEWVLEFKYPDLAGSHMDGLEVVTDPNTGTAYVYVSDMTSDFLGQYKRERGGSWEQANLFQYAGTGEPVEGMGFGAHNHFWMTSGDSLYEVGGGELQKYTEPEAPPR